MPRRLSEPDTEAARKRLALNGTRLPEPIRIGEVFTDVQQNQWKLGRSIGVGGFGEIYLASDDVSKPVGSDAQYVIKIEPHSNGPLFVEMNFYIRAAKTEMINEWIKGQKLKRLGMPHYIGSGSHLYKGEKYRFLVLERFEEDLHKLFLRKGRRFHFKTALTLGIQILDILEYIHSCGYIHADIKASNLLLGRGNESTNQVYLLDYGLAYHYLDGRGVHKEYRSDERRAHNGTIEYTSRDAHIGAGSRRGDLETLGYNLLQWVCGKLPWESHTESPTYVHEQKVAVMGNIPLLMKTCSTSGVQPPAALGDYMKYVAGLAFHAKPDYALCKRLLRQGIKDSGFADNNRLEFGNEVVPLPVNRLKKGRKRRAHEEPENISPVKPLKVFFAVPPRQPCVAQNCNRMTRNSSAMPVLRSSHAFNWAEVLSRDPEKQFKKQIFRKSPPTPLSCFSIPVKGDSIPTSKPGDCREMDIIPTPAMLEVMAIKKRRPSYQSSLRKGRDSNSSPSSTTNTAEMERVIRRREELRLQGRASNCDTAAEDDDVVYMTRLAKRRLNQASRNFHIQVAKSAARLAALEKTFKSRNGAVKRKAMVLTKRS